MPSARPTVSTWTSWPSPTGMSSEVSGAKGSERRPPALPASASGAIVAAGLRRSPGEIAVDEAVAAGRGLDLSLLENLFVHRRQRAGRVGVAGIAGQRKRLAAAAAEIDFPELAALARLLHPSGAAIAIEGFGILPDPGDRMIRAHAFELKPGDGFGGVAGQHLAGRRDIEELPAPATHAFLRPQRVIIRHHKVDGQNALEPDLGFLDDA